MRARDYTREAPQPAQRGRDQGERPERPVRIHVSRPLDARVRGRGSVGRMTLPLLCGKSRLKVSYSRIYGNYPDQAHGLTG
jgi:hypothetical protein